MNNHQQATHLRQILRVKLRISKKTTAGEASNKATLKKSIKTLHRNKRIIPVK